jgi:ankyrin repeat protein
LNAAIITCVKSCNTRRLEDSLQCVEALIVAGANVKAEESEEGKTALMIACAGGYLELV